MAYVNVKRTYLYCLGIDVLDGNEVFALILYLNMSSSGQTLKVSKGAKIMNRYNRVPRTRQTRPNWPGL